MGVCHSADFPELFEEKVAVIITLDDKIIFEILIDIKEKINVHEFKHFTRESGLFKFRADLIPLNYRGLEISENFEIKVLKTSDKRTVINQFIF